MHTRVMVSLVGVRGYGLPELQLRALPKTLVTKDVVTLPDVIVDDAGVDPLVALRPIFDAMWQTFGLPRSLSYDKHGVWEQFRP